MVAPDRAAKLLVAAVLLGGPPRAALHTFKSHIPGELLAALAEREELDEAGRDLVRTVHREAYAVEADEYLAVLHGHLAAMCSLVESSGADVVLLSYPSFRLGIERTQTQVASECGVPFVAVRERFDAERRSRAYEELFVADGHCNEHGYQLMAELAAPAVARLLERRAR